MRLSHQQNLKVGYKEAINQSKNIKVIFVFFMQSILFQESEGKCNVKLSIVSFILLRIFFNALGISWPCFFFVWFFFFLFICLCCFLFLFFFQAAFFKHSRNQWKLTKRISIFRKSDIFLWNIFLTLNYRLLSLTVSFLLVSLLIMPDF